MGELAASYSVAIWRKMRSSVALAWASHSRVTSQRAAAAGAWVSPAGAQPASPAVAPTRPGTATLVIRERRDKGRAPPG